MWINLGQEVVDGLKRLFEGEVHALKDYPSHRDTVLKLRAQIGDFESDLPSVNSQAKKFIEAAKKHCREGQVEVDDSAVVSFGDDSGAYVMAWLWVSDQEMET